MIKCKIDKSKGKGVVKAKGMSDEVVAEILTLIHIIYQQVPDEHKTSFKNTIIGGVLDPKSPVWRDDHGTEN